MRDIDKVKAVLNALGVKYIEEEANGFKLLMIYNIEGRGIDTVVQFVFGNETGNYITIERA